jgi:hypothetical protein
MTIRDASSAAREHSAAAVRRAAHGALSMRARVGYVALMVVSVCSTAGLVSLWTTEPGLPQRTHVAFAALAAILLAWASFAVWVLRSRRILYGYDRVVAGRLSVTFCALFVLGMVAAGAITGLRGPWGGAAIGLVMLALAVRQLRRAARRFLELVAQRDALSRELDAGAGP